VSAALAPVAEAARPARARAWDAFTERLLAREILPGQFVSQRELVELTGMPLGAIRELIPRLETEGLITTVPQRGLQVAAVDLSLVRNAFQFRLMLEREAVAVFVAEAEDGVIAGLRERHERVLAQAGERITPELIREAQRTDWELHDSIVDALGNEIVSSSYRVNSIKIRLIRQEQVRLDPSRVAGVMQDHLAILERIASRDAAGAQALLGSHILDARNRAMGV